MLLTLKDANNCPHCGWNLLQSYCDNTTDPVSFWVYCPLCFRSSPKIYLPDDAKTYSLAEHQAVTLWNEGQVIKDRKFIRKEKRFSKEITKKIKKEYRNKI